VSDPFAPRIEILLVEDNLADARLVREQLRDSGSAVAVTHAEGLSSALEYLRAQGFHVVLLDLSLPESEGLDTFSRARAAAPEAPIVVLTGLDDEELAVRAVREGAQDYLVKDRVDGVLLGQSIRFAIERKRVEREIREREERFRQIAESIHEVFFVVDVSFRETVYISPAYERVWGRSCQSAYDAPQSFLEGVAEDDRPRLIENIREIQQGIETDGVEFRVVRPDGQVVWVHSNASPIRNQAGEVYRLAGVALDITSRVRAEQAVRASEERLRTLFEAVNLIVLGLDAEGCVEYVNPFFLALSGYSAGEVIGEAWVDRFVPEEGRESLSTAFRELLAHGANRHHRNPILTRDGRTRAISWHNTVVRDTEGRPAGTLSIGEDVTEHELLEEQFRQAQKMEAVGRLAGGIAHDFNNLLTVIGGHSELLLSELPPADPHRADLEAIHRAGESASSLTRQLLAFSRQQVLAPRVLELNSVVMAAEVMLRRLLGEDVRLLLRLAPALGAVRADAGQLEQVLMNLAINARDAMPRGGDLILETANIAVDDANGTEISSGTPGPYVLLRVADSGVGMDAATRARLFEPFFTTKDEGKGTGLGLATVYAIVKQSGGFLRVRSELGEGATFEVYLPRVAGALSASKSVPDGPVARGSETVLLVEDSAPVRAIARLVLERQGYTVVEAPEATVAIAHAERLRRPLHLLLTDLVMPGMNGRDLADRVLEIRPDLRVLFMSGYTSDSALRAGVVEGGMPYLQKPFTAEGLARKVREVLDGPPTHLGAR
jgi:PAS domain S-box-containing protein